MHIGETLTHWITISNDCRLFGGALLWMKFHGDKRMDYLAEWYEDINQRHNKHWAVSGHYVYQHQTHALRPPPPPTNSWEEPGFEPLTFRLLHNPLYLLSYSHSINYQTRFNMRSKGRQWLQQKEDYWQRVPDSIGSRVVGYREMPFKSSTLENKCRCWMIILGVLSGKAF